jgi:hypothetical protein
LGRGYDASHALPAFLAELKSLPAFKDYGQALLRLQQFVFQNACSRATRNHIMVLAAMFGVVALMGADRS